jgi:MFS family permease
VYSGELFPTGSRSTANGGINVMGVAGSVSGLLAAGVLADRFGSFAPTMAVLGIFPIVAVGIVLLLYPETADRELEELNPEDAPPPSGDDLARLDDEFEERGHQGVL